MEDDDLGLTHYTHRDFFFNCLPQDILVNIFSRLEEDPCHLPRLACVCTRFSKLIRTSCWKLKCMRVIPALVADLVQPSQRSSETDHFFSEPPGGWGALQKLLFCCPGLLHAGVLVKSRNLGRERELGLNEGYEVASNITTGHLTSDGTREHLTSSVANAEVGEVGAASSYGVFSRGKGLDICSVGKLRETTKRDWKETTKRDWKESFGERKIAEEFDMWESEALATNSEFNFIPQIGEGGVPNRDHFGTTCANVRKGCEVNPDRKLMWVNADNTEEVDVFGTRKHIECSQERVSHEVDPQDFGLCDEGRPRTAQLESPGQSETERREFHPIEKGNKRRKKSRRDHPHLASGNWNFSREQGNKLLANRFRTDSLYICDWPGCVHPGEKRNYKLFRGVFKKFKASHVWRNLNDMKAKKINIPCVFCSCESTWDMVANFCLKRSIGSHEDGEPFVRAYVCDNGHIAGAWTDRPLYNM